MKILSKVFDRRINCTNLYIEISFREYLSFAQNILKNNELQRKRVKTSKTVYSLLRDDLKQGCVMPPLVLATTHEMSLDIDNEDLFFKHLQCSTSNILILDGLQRTYTLIDAATEVKEQDPENYENFLNYTLRLEIYIGINKFGILYRMLSLNTGQTPMTARHQLEMLYKDLLDTQIGEIKLVTDVMDSPNPSNNEFAFKNVIEGFNSFLTRNELPIDREDLLENIKMLDNISMEKVDHDLFVDFVNCYAKIFKAMRELTEDKVYSREELQEIEITSPFGNSVYKVFSTSQALTGFGAAIGRMKELKLIESLEDISNLILSLSNNNESSWFEELLINLNKIKISAKKIGNAQRMYFHYFFRDLLNSETDSYLNLKKAVETGYHKYYSQL